MVITSLSNHETNMQLTFRFDVAKGAFEVEFNGPASLARIVMDRDQWNAFLILVNRLVAAHPALKYPEWR